jgi:hypothetical protein
MLCYTYTVYLVMLKDVGLHVTITVLKRGQIAFWKLIIPLPVQAYFSFHGSERFYYHVHRTPRLDTIRSQANAVHPLTSQAFHGPF